MSWWRRLFANRRMERDLDSELRFHMEPVDQGSNLDRCG
jgi:hypothetical protein